MSAMHHVIDMPALRVWEDVVARVVHGAGVSLAVVEIPPNRVVPEHQHHNEQLGVLLRGSVRFTIGSEVQDLTPGAVWCIPGDVPHDVVAGPDGAVIVESFAPRRADWEALNAATDPRLTWPDGGEQ